MIVHNTTSKTSIFTFIFQENEEKNSADSFQEKHTHDWHTKVRNGKRETADNLQVAFMNNL